MTESTLRLFVVRHGDTAYSEKQQFAGSRDIPLSPTGAAQCRAVAERLAQVKVSAIYSSQAERARTSAEIIAAPHGLLVTVDNTFREMTLGRWEGFTREEVAARFPDDYRTWRSAPHTLSFHGAETLDDVRSRVSAGLARVADMHKGRVVVLVTHAIVVRLLVLDALGLGLERLWSIDASPAGITDIEYEAGATTVHAMNTVAHLPPNCIQPTGVRST